MTRRIPTLAPALVLAAALAATPPTLGSTPGEAPQTVTLRGDYMSSYQNSRRPLTAVFTPDGEGAWSVVFQFHFNGRDLEYRGTADGDLEQGALSGKVRDERQQRTFTFRGEFEDGAFDGTHAEIGRRGRESRTGTLTLRR